MAAGLSMVQSGYADPKPTLDEAQEKVDELNHEVEQATERYHLAGEEMERVDRRLARAKDAIAKQEKKIDEAVADVAGYASATYQTGGIDPTIRTLVAEDPVGYLSRAAVLDAYARQQADQISAVVHERRELEQAKLAADEELARLKAIEDERAAEQTTIEESLAEAQEVLDQLEEEERQRLEEERRRREEERDDAADDPSRGDNGDEDDPPPSGRVQDVIDFAMAQVGDPYQWAAEGPHYWDCSGLTLKSWAQAGVSLPRSSSSQIGVGTRVSRSQLQPGDLVFYYSPISHVGIYIGGGQMVHATHPGDVVSVDSVDSMPFAGATRPG